MKERVTGPIDIKRAYMTETEQDSMAEELLAVEQLLIVRSECIRWRNMFFILHQEAREKIDSQSAEAEKSFDEAVKTCYEGLMSTHCKLRPEDCFASGKVERAEKQAIKKLFSICSTYGFDQQDLHQAIIFLANNEAVMTFVKWLEGFADIMYLRAKSSTVLQI